MSHKRKITAIHKNTFDKYCSSSHWAEPLGAALGLGSPILKEDVKNLTEFLKFSAILCIVHLQSLTQKERLQCRTTYEIHHHRIQIPEIRAVPVLVVVLVVVAVLFSYVDPLVSYFLCHTKARLYLYWLPPYIPDKIDDLGAFLATDASTANRTNVRTNWNRKKIFMTKVNYS